MYKSLLCHQERSKKLLGTLKVTDGLLSLHAAVKDSIDLLNPPPKESATGATFTLPDGTDTGNPIPPPIPKAERPKIRPTYLKAGQEVEPPKESGTGDRQK